MKAHLVWLFTVINLVLLASAAGASAHGPAAPGTADILSAPVGSAFTYQGRLRDARGPVSGVCDFQFSLWAVASGGTQPIATVPSNNVSVADGRFATRLDFGAAVFNGETRWMQVAVRCPAGVGTFTTLVPREALAPTPYALRATAAGSVPWSGISGIPAGFADGVDNGGYTIGNGLTLNGTVLSVAIPLGLAGSQPLSIIVARNNAPIDTGNGAYATGVWGVSTNGRGLEGDSTSHFGVAGFSASSAGVLGRGTGTGVDNFGVYGIQGIAGPGSNVPVALMGTTNTSNGIGVFGLSTTYKGVEGYSRDSYGVQGYSVNSYGVYGSTGSSSSYAGYFAGNVRITGSCCAAAAGTYQIDDPLDPANKYLTHAAVQSSEMKNVYDGVVALDASGAATVVLPDWFEALNRDFRYQITAIGAPAPNLYIAEEIKGNRFTIAGGKPGMKVSWQVTGIRHDPYAASNPIQVEADKPAEKRGKYLYPQGYGQPAAKGEHDAAAAASTPSQARSQPAAP